MSIKTIHSGDDDKQNYKTKEKVKICAPKISEKWKVKENEQWRF